MEAPVEFGSLKVVSKGIATGSGPAPPWPRTSVQRVEPSPESLAPEPAHPTVPPSSASRLQVQATARGVWNGADPEIQGLFRHLSMGRRHRAGSTAVVSAFERLGMTSPQVAPIPKDRVVLASSEALVRALAPKLRRWVVGQTYNNLATFHLAAQVLNEGGGLDDVLSARLPDIPKGARAEGNCNQLSLALADSEAFERSVLPEMCRPVLAISSPAGEIPASHGLLILPFQNPGDGGDKGYIVIDAGYNYTIPMVAVAGRTTCATQGQGPGKACCEVTLSEDGSHIVVDAAVHSGMVRSFIEVGQWTNPESMNAFLSLFLRRLVMTSVNSMGDLAGYLKLDFLNQNLTMVAGNRKVRFPLSEAPSKLSRNISDSFAGLFGREREKLILEIEGAIRSEPVVERARQQLRARV